MSERGIYRASFEALADDADYQDLSPLAQAVFHTLKLKLGQYGIAVFYPSLLQEYHRQASPLALEQAMAELAAVKPSGGDGWIVRERNVVWLRNGLKYEPSLSLENANHRKGAYRWAMSLPKLAVVDAFIRSYDLGEPLGIPSRSHPDPIPNGWPIRERERDTERETESLVAVATSDAEPTEQPTPAEPEPVAPPPAVRRSAKASKAKAADEPGVQIVLGHYTTVHPRRRPGPKDAKAVAKALETYTPAELCQAIDGNARDTWHAEHHKHELPYVLRDNGLIDSFREKATALSPESAKLLREADPWLLEGLNPRWAT